MSNQCITCQYTVMDKQPRGMGLCWKEEPAKRKPIDVMEVRNCKLWNLAGPHQVHGRSQRRIVFNEKGIARLE